jgi:hypothetical protein
MCLMSLCRIGGLGVIARCSGSQTHQFSGTVYKEEELKVTIKKGPI